MSVLGQMDITTAVTIVATTFTLTVGACGSVFKFFGDSEAKKFRHDMRDKLNQLNIALSVHVAEQHVKIISIENALAGLTESIQKILDR